MIVDKRNFWQKRRTWEKGLIISAVLLAGGAVYFAFDTYQYTGTCGESIIPFAGKNPHACSFWEYLSSDYRQDLGFLTRVILEDFWYYVLAILLIPAFIGYLVDLSRWGKRP